MNGISDIVALFGVKLGAFSKFSSGDTATVALCVGRNFLTRVGSGPKKFDPDPG